MSKVLLFFYLNKNPKDFIKNLNLLLTNMQDKKNYEIVIHLNEKSNLSKNESLKTHLNKYKNTSVVFTSCQNAYAAFDKTLSENIYEYDYLLPFIEDIQVSKKFWDKTIKEKFNQNVDYFLADKIPAIKKSYLDKKKNLFNHSTILECKYEYYTNQTQKGIFNTKAQIDFSYIICYRHSDDRYKNLIKVIDWLKNFNCEIIIVEQDNEKKLDLQKPYINHIFTYSNKGFNRSWAFNCGALESESTILVFGDCDLIIDVNEFKDSVEYIRTSDCECLSPFNKVIDLKQEESTFVDIKNWRNIQRKSRMGINLTGGIVLYKKDSFMKISGWNEDFEGWGGEDDYMSYKSQTFLKSGVKPYKCYHMWHPPAKKIPELYKNNLNILKNVRGRDRNSFLNEFNNRRKLIGNKNKYKKENDTMSYSEYLKNKRVILVGPAPHLIDSNQKQFIESFDVVVRLNVALPVAEERYKDIGERTDILYNCLSENKEDGGKTNFEMWSKSIKWLGIPYPKWGVFKKQMENFEKKNSTTPFKLKFSYIDTQYYIKLEKDLGCRPNTGFCAIMDLLSYDIKELYVTGMTFFKGGYDPSYRKSIDGIEVLDENHSESLVHKRMNKAGNHRQQPQIDYMKKVFSQNDKLKGDNEFEKILTEK